MTEHHNPIEDSVTKPANAAVVLQLSGSLPPGEHNGLDALAERLTWSREPHLIIARVALSKVVTHAGGGKIVVIAKLTAAEVCLHGGQEWEEANELLEGVREQRTGSVRLPMTE